MATPANTNCLENVRCPNCGNSDAFTLTALAEIRVTDDGAEPIGAFEYDDTVHAECPDCQFAAPWGLFQTPAVKIRYSLEVTFDADRILTPRELDCISATVGTCVEEPVVINGPDEDWEPAEWVSSNVTTTFQNVVIVNGQAEVRPIL
jgi:hypothetical protein